MISLGDLQHALASPSIDSWHTICAYGNLLLSQEKQGIAGVGTMMIQFETVFRRELKVWPPEFDRKVPKHWPTQWIKMAEYRIKETDSYGYYEAGVCSDPRLRLSDGSQAVHLKRRFTGAVRSMEGTHVMKLGLTGEPDLQGGMVVEFTIPPSVVSMIGGSTVGSQTRIEIVVELEVKAPTGRLSPEQAQRREAAKRRGRINEVVETVKHAADLLLGHQARLKELLSR